MSPISRHLAIGLLACVCAAAAQAQIILYEHDDFKGRAIRGSDNISNLKERGFNDVVSSVNVLTGTWEVCTDANFRGSCTVLRPGRYPSLQHMGMNDRLSSVRSVSSGQAGGAYSDTSVEYKRGYNDGLKGNRFDSYRHPQDYKDGFNAGEDARRGGSQSNAPTGEYDINRMSNGGFEVVWPQRGCIATFNSRGEAMSFNERCDDYLINRSHEIARRERY
jgi:hypothetical protein